MRAVSPAVWPAAVWPAAVLVNTSFNVRGEPIVTSPADAIRCMANSRIDTLVLEDHLIDKEDIPRYLRAIAKQGSMSFRDRVERDIHPRLRGGIERWRPGEGGLPEGVYTFV